MKKVLFLLAFIFQLTNLYSQFGNELIDSTIKNYQLNNQDWVIFLSIEQAGMIYDSNGNTLRNDPNGTYILSKINEKCYLQKCKINYEGERPVLKFGYKTNIFDSVLFSYNKDSIQRGEHESIFPNICRNDSLGVYYVQQQSDHSPFYQISFRTMESFHNLNFAEIDVFTSPIYSALFLKNLNQEHNRNTFIYRAFLNTCRLIKTQYHISIPE